MMNENIKNCQNISNASLNAVITLIIRMASHEAPPIHQKGRKHLKKLNKKREISKCAQN
jgi:hypothetical protein